MDDLDGQIIHGYEIREKIGSGGFGAVYRAYQPRLKRDVALKIILPQYANDPDFIRQFEVEAELVARLEHPHIVPLFDFWRDPNGAYLVLRFLPGGSLREYLQDNHLALDALASLLDQTSAALHIAHRNNVVHRDIKPANILLDTDGNAYLTDFGIAKIRGVDTLSPGGSLTGSLPYVAPEQIQHSTVVPQTDIYALGIVLYEVLARKHPFPTDSVSEILYNHLQKPVPDISEIYPTYPAEINQVIQKATAKDFNERYTDVRLLAKAFREAIGPRPIESQEVAVDTVITTSDATVIITDTPPKPSNPYRGLLAFQEHDAHLFFGREASVERLLIGLSESQTDGRFLAVVGPSGSGKSSLVKAGLLPALRQGALSRSDEWFVVEMTPGNEPLAELGATLLRIAVQPMDNLAEKLWRKNGLTSVLDQILPNTHDEVLIFVDQFEEVFTMVEDEKIRRQFLNNLFQAVNTSNSRIHIVITLRADFYDRPLQYRDFGKLLQEHTATILPLSADELHTAIEKPALYAGVELQTGLTQILINAVEEQPSPLPLLQYTLTELFEERSGRYLTLEAYQRLGGVAGAVAKRAEDLYQQLDNSYQISARQLFLRLVTLNQDSDVLRRRAFLTEIQQDEDTETILERYINHRLLILDRDAVSHEPTVEVAHEALFKTWERLRDWIEDSRDDLRIHQRFTEATREWLAADKHPEFLVQGVRLAQFEAWYKQSVFNLSENEQQLLTASLEKREVIYQKEEERQAHELNLQRQAANRLRYVAITLTLGLLVASGLLIFALNNQQKARTEANNAQTQAVRAENNEATSIAERNRADEAARLSRSRELASQALNQLDNKQFDLAILLSLEALQAAESYEATNSLLTALTDTPHLRKILHEHTDQVRSVAYDPTGQFMASASSDQRIILRNATDGTPLLEALVGHRSLVTALAFNSDGSVLASGGADQMIILWDTQTGERIGEALLGHENEIWSLDFSPDNQILVSASEDGTIVLWNVASSEQIGEPLSAHNDIVFSVMFAPDGQTLASGGADNTVRLWDVVSGKQIGEPFIGHTNWVLNVAFSPDGQILASSGADGTIILWDVTSHEAIGDALTGHIDWVRSIDFSPNGAMLVSGGTDNLVLLWDVASRNLINFWDTGHQNGVRSVAFSADGNQLASGGVDGTVRLWETQFSDKFREYYNDHPGQVHAVAFLPDQEGLISASSDGTVIMANSNGSAITDIAQVNVQDVVSASISPDGQTVAFGSIGGSVTLWDTNRHEIVGQFVSDPNRIILALAFSPDGTVLASGDDNSTINLWNIATQSEIDELVTINNEDIQALAFNSDGTILASGEQNGRIYLWDVATGELFREPLLLHRDRVLSLAFSPHINIFASGDRMGNIIVWDMTAHEPIIQFTQADTEIYSLAFSRDGGTIAAAGRNQIITLWDIHSGGILGTPFAGHNSWIISLAFNSDSTALISGDRGGTVSFWDLSIESRTNSACQIANRNLSEIEWQRFIPDEIYRATCDLSS